MNYLQTLILAIIQGAAELLPVSSSAHVIFAEKLMGLDPASPEMVFLLVMLHTGTMFAVLVYFWPRWRTLFRAAPDHPGGSGSPGQPWLHFLKMLALATVVTGVVGYGLKMFLEDIVLVRLLHHPKAEVEELFRYLPLMAASLFVVGLLIIAAGLFPVKREQEVVSPRASFWIGLVQGLCIPFRGFSRSGATISTALFCGVSRQRAEDFSFALAVILTPPVIARGLYKLLKDRALQGHAELMHLVLPGLVGMAFSFLAGLVALKFLSAVLERGRWQYFGYYCLVASAVVFVAAACGW
jgi:undecaprenyl-diphosphatase